MKEIHTKSFKYDDIKYLIMDECDRLLDLGFLNNIKETLTIINLRSNIDYYNKINILVSATINKNIIH